MQIDLRELITGPDGSVDPAARNVVPLLKSMNETGVGGALRYVCEKAIAVRHKQAEQDPYHKQVPELLTEAATLRAVMNLAETAREVEQGGEVQWERSCVQ
jgi:hypothetical protein